MGAKDGHLSFCYSDRSADETWGKMRAIALLTSGGDSPGMNACVRAAARAALDQGVLVWGVHDGYDGLVFRRMERLSSRGVAGILQRGGTILGAGRCEEFLDEANRKSAVEYIHDRGIEGLVVIGGDGSMQGVWDLHLLGLSVVGVPGTIDNDVAGTDLCIGTDTAVNTAVEAIDRLRDTASAHHRAMIVEVMGRQSGYLARMAALASGAEMVITPERPVELQQVFDEMQQMGAKGKRHFIIVVAEGASMGAIELTKLINEADNPYEARCQVLGYIQRGGSPSAADRVLATRMGVAAVDALVNGQSGVLVGWRGDRVVLQSLEQVSERPSATDAALDRVLGITAT
jgi:6-phosphofructokinase 1